MIKLSSPHGQRRQLRLPRLCHVVFLPQRPLTTLRRRVAWGQSEQSRRISSLCLFKWWPPWQEKFACQIRVSGKACTVAWQLPTRTMYSIAYTWGRIERWKTTAILEDCGTSVCWCRDVWMCRRAINFLLQILLWRKLSFAFELACDKEVWVDLERVYMLDEQQGVPKGGHQNDLLRVEVTKQSPTVLSFKLQVSFQAQALKFHRVLQTPLMYH